MEGHGTQMTTPALINPTLRTPQQATHDMAQARLREGNPEAAARIMAMLRRAQKTQGEDADRRTKEATRL